MKDLDLSVIGIHIHTSQASQEAQRAQRMAELENLAKYRAMKIQQYKDWSDPVKRAALQAKYKLWEEEGRKKLHEIPAELVAVRTGKNSHTISKIVFRDIPPKPKTFWQRLKEKLTGLIPRCCR